MKLALGMFLLVSVDVTINVKRCPCHGCHCQYQRVSKLIPGGVTVNAVRFLTTYSRTLRAFPTQFKVTYGRLAPNTSGMQLNADCCNLVESTYCRRDGGTSLFHAAERRL